MIFLVILACLAAFVAVLFLLLYLLVAKVRFCFDTDTGVFSLSIKILFFNIKILPAGKKKKKNKPQKRKKDHIFADENKNIDEMSDNVAKVCDKKKSVGEKTQEFKKLMASVCEKIKILVPGVFGALALDIRRLDIVVGGEDAAKAAINYGIVCAGVEGLYAVGNSCKKLNVGDDVFVTVDYLEEKFRCEFDIILKVRVFKILTTVLYAFS